MKPFYAVIIPLGDSDAHPEHPIVIPPPGGGTTPPPGGGNGAPPHPTHPIPPTIWPSPPTGGTTPPPGGEKPPEGPIPPALEWHTVWSEAYGWVLVGVPTGPHPNPSKGPGGVAQPR